MSHIIARMVSAFSTGHRLIRMVRTDGGRQVWQARDHRGRRLVLIRARSLRAVKRVRREIALLKELRATGVTAVPALKWCGLAAYAIAEGPSALAPRKGKRASRAMVATGETEMANVAADLAGLLVALHSRNLALGLQGLRGIELSPHGRVVVTDFSHVATLTPVKKRADKQWLARLTNGADTYRYAQRRTGEREEYSLREWGMVDPSAQHPHGRRSKPEEEIAPSPSERRAKGSGQRRLWILTPMALKLALPAVLLCAALAGGLMFTAPSENTPPAMIAETRIEDPAAIMTSLAAARHSYLIGETDDNLSAAPGSEAELADKKLRAALAGTMVEGGEMRVLEARTLEQSESGARVRVRVEETGARISAPNETRALDESEPYEVDIRLERVAGQWRIVSTVPFEKDVESA